MIILNTAQEMHDWSTRAWAKGQQIGFVPTMGALHEGHASLMRAAVAENNGAVLSIFVNPAQFAPHEDFGRYPRTFDADCALADDLGVAAVYAPAAEAMYPPDYSSYVEVGGVSEGLCGASRPHFYRGVCTVVTKLFNAVKPHRAYFGQKDAQQTAVIRRMVRDLDMDIEIIEMPIVREADGLAMSSRNRYLSPEERERALALSRSLQIARTAMADGERDADTLITQVREALEPVRVDYVALVDTVTMEPVTTIKQPVLLAIAAYVGNTRLIDNIKFIPPDAH